MWRNQGKAACHRTFTKRYDIGNDSLMNGHLLNHEKHQFVLHAHSKVSQVKLLQQAPLPCYKYAMKLEE